MNSKIILILSLLTMVSAEATARELALTKTQPVSLSCFVGIFKAKDMKTSQDQSSLAGTAVEVKLDKDGNGELETDINGLPIVIQAIRSNYTQVFSFDITILKSKANGGTLLTLNNELIYQGAAKEGDFSPNIKPEAQLYEYINHQSGNFIMSLELREALIKAGLYGINLSTTNRNERFKYTNSLLDIMTANQLFTDVPLLIEKGYLKPETLTGIMTAYSCTGNIK